MAKMTVGLYLEYRIVFFPFATFKRVGDHAILTIFGLPVYRRVGDLVILTVFGLSVYRRVGDVRNICGITVSRGSHAS